MKNLLNIFVFLFSFFFSFNFAFGQEKMEEKRYIPYNVEIGDWDIVFPLPDSVNVAPEYGAKIVIITGIWEEFPAEITERGVEFVHPTEIWFHQGWDYAFRTIVYDQDGRGYLSEVEFIYAPSFEAVLQYRLSGNTLDLEIRFENDLGLTPSLENSEFSIVPLSSDSIIHERYESKMFDFSTSQKLVGMTELYESSVKQKIISYFVTMENQFGVPRLWDVDAKLMLAGVEKRGFKIMHNLTGVGAITPYFDNNEPKNGFIVSSDGRVVKKILVQSGEAFWPGVEVPAGMYYLHVPEIGTEPFIKAISD